MTTPAETTTPAPLFTAATIDAKTKTQAFGLTPELAELLRRPTILDPDIEDVDPIAVLNPIGMTRNGMNIVHPLRITVRYDGNYLVEFIARNQPFRDLEHPEENKRLLYSANSYGNDGLKAVFEVLDQITSDAKFFFQIDDEELESSEGKELKDFFATYFTTSDDEDSVDLT